MIKEDIVQIEFRISSNENFNLSMFTESGKSKCYRVKKVDLINFIRNNNIPYE